MAFPIPMCTYLLSEVVIFQKALPQPVQTEGDLLCVSPRPVIACSRGLGVCSHLAACASRACCFGHLSSKVSKTEASTLCQPSRDPPDDSEQMDAAIRRHDFLCSFWFWGRNGNWAANPRTKPPLPWGCGGKDEKKLPHEFPTIVKMVFS